MTVSSNIHIGLANWGTNRAYTLGARVAVSANGNAYQCITAGTSSGSGTGPSGTGSSISDGSVTWKYLSAIDYTSMNAWTSSIPTTLTQNVIGNLWNDGPITTTGGTPFFALTGHTTGSFTITLQAAAGESFRDAVSNQTTALNFNQTKGVAFVLPSSGVGNINYVQVSDNNVTLSGLQFQDPNASSNCSIIQLGGTSNVLAGCLVDGYAQTTGADMIYLNATSGTTIVRNCLIIDREPTGSAASNAINTYAPTTHIVNCTIIGINNPTNSSPIFNNSTGALTTTNCIMMGYQAANVAPAPNGGTSTIQYSLMSNAGAGLGGTNGSGNIFSASIANQFVNPTTDFRLKSGSGAVDAGTTDTSDIPNADDIAKTSRPSGTKWDIGAWELVQAAPSVTLTGVSSSAGVGSVSASLPSARLIGMASFAQTSDLIVNVASTQSSMFMFTDGNIPTSAQFNNNFANTIDKTTATPQSMAASLAVGGTLTSANLITSGMLTARGGQIVNVNVLSSGSSYSMQPNDYFVTVNKTVSSSTTIILPSSPAPGRTYTISDGKGNAQANPITIQASQNIAAYTTWVLNTAFASATFIYSGTQWYLSGHVGPFDGTIVSAPGTSRVSNTVTGLAAVAFGSNNTSTGIASIAGGATNTASGNQSIALGNNSTASALNSVSLGTFANDRGRIGHFSFSNGRLGSNSGDSQYSETVFRKTIAATTTGRLTADGSTPTAANTCALVNGIAYGFGRITVLAFDPVNNAAAMWRIDNLLMIRGLTAGSTTIVGSPTVTLVQASASLSALTAGSVTVAADTTLGSLNISLNNASSVSLDVVSVINMAEVF